MHRHILYIINPVSGTGRKNDLQQLIKRKTEEKKIPFIIYPSVANGDYSLLLPVIAKEKITDVVIAGGDGTVSQVVGSLLHSGVNFGILPCGSGNGLAYAAKIPRHISKALDVVFNGKPVVVDGIDVNGSFACMLCGMGFDARVAHDFANQTKRGLTNYIKLVAKNFFSSKTYPFSIQLKEQVFSTDAFFVSIANSNQFGNQFTIAPKASLYDGLLDVVIVTKQNKLSMFLQILKQLAGANRLQIDSAIDQNKAVIYFQTDQLSILNQSHAPLHIDGEPVTATGKIEIRILKKCFRLIQP